MTAALLRRSRGIAIALVVLALSATAAFAAAPVLHLASGPAAGTQAEEPDANENEQGEDVEQGDDANENEQGDDAEQGDEAEQGDDAETPDSEEAEGPEAEEAGPSEDTHGALVSEAAQLETPEGFANHGAFVSCVARMKDVAAAGFDWTTVTPESCAAAEETKDAAKAAAKAQRDAKVHGTGNGKGKGAEMRAAHAGGN